MMEIRKMGAVSKIWKTLLAGGAGVAALAAVNATVSRRELETPEDAHGALGGEAASYEWKYATIAYRVAGAQSTPPLLFIHDIGAGISSSMWRRNFAALAASFRVYAVDLPGFGASAKPPTAPYSADFYVECLGDFIREVINRPTQIIASSLGAAFALRLADEQPERVGKLLLIAPPFADAFRPGMTSAAFYSLMHSPVLGTSFYNAVASERSIRDYAAKRFFYDRRFVTDALVADLYALSHQPGAQHAIAALRSGFLHTETREPFTRINKDVTIAIGREDEANTVEIATKFVALNPSAKLVVFDCARAWLQEEHAEQFNNLATRTLRTLRVATA